MVKGKLQLNLYDGKNIISDKTSYKVGDSVLLSLPEHKVSKHLTLSKKSAIFLIGGKHIGSYGNVDDIINNKITYMDANSNLIQTSKKYAFVIGDGKPLININTNEPDEKN